MKLFSTILFVCFYSFGFGQIEGLWEVKKVSVGDQSMTPTARWFHLLADMTYESGNGGLQHDQGTYAIDRDQLLFTNAEGIVDEMGPFKYQISGEQLTLNRKEEGMQVTVHLTKVQKKPYAPWDLIIGNWTLDKVTKNEEDITGTFTEGKNISYFLRWDRLYFKNEGDNSSPGIWFIHGHRMEVRLIPHDRNNKDEFWKLRFPKDGTMEWHSTDGSVIQTFIK